jgi:hypothetical protein
MIEVESVLETQAGLLSILIPISELSRSCLYHYYKSFLSWTGFNLAVSKSIATQF